MRTSFEDPRQSVEVETDMATVGLLSAIRSLIERRDDPTAYRTMRANFSDINEAFSLLFSLVQQIRGHDLTTALVGRLVLAGATERVACEVVAEALVTGHLATPWRREPMVAPGSFRRLRNGEPSAAQVAR